MKSTWTDLLKQYRKKPSRLLEDELISCFISWPDKFAAKFGKELNHTDREDLVSELYLALVFTIREKLPGMYNNRLDWLVSSRLFYTARKFLRNRQMTIKLEDCLVDTEPSVEEALMFDETVDQVVRETGQTTVMADMIDGVPAKVTASQLGISVTRVYQIREKLIKRVIECVN